MEKGSPMKRLVPRLAILLLLLFALAWLGSTAGQTPGRSGAGESEELDVFVPSEKVPADSAISFPVDI